MFKSQSRLALLYLVAACGLQNGKEKANEAIPLSDSTARMNSPAAVADTNEISFSKQMQNDIARVMGAHFQSCAPLLHPGMDVKTILNKYFDEIDDNLSKKCIDRRNDDLRYVSFGKGSLDPNAGLLQEINGKIDALARFNCSGFVAATMTAGGLKYFKGQTSKFYSPRTHEIADIFKRQDSCFFQPTLSKAMSILPGDILNVGHSHTVRVYSIGADPLGLGRIERKSDCEKISKKDLDFTYAHSTSRDKTEGVTGLRVENAKERGASIIETLLNAVRTMCRENFKDGDVAGVIEDKKVGEKEFAGGLVKYDQIFALRRHIGTSNKSCTFNAPEVKGERCIQDKCYGKTN
ncbi:MAG: hypothetical protein RI953_588 [Pseudomonadota bacterium]|jgi:hypothetical protein